MKIVFFLLTTFVAGSLLAEDVMSSTAAPASSASISSQILESYGTGSYAETAKLLEQFREKDPEAFGALPYELLYAKVLVRSKQPERALHAYRALNSKPQLRRFVSLPAARLAAELKLNEEALRFYTEALQDRGHPEHAAIAREALEFAWLNKNAEALKNLAGIVGKFSWLNRLSQFYLARVHLLQKNSAAAQSAFLQLIRAKKEDDTTSQALMELDALEGTNLSREEAVVRGKLAYRVWNFELARKYLKAYSNDNITNAYFYARSIAFLGETQSGVNLLQAAAAKWPSDPMARLCLYQYGNLCLRMGEYKKAGETFAKLRKTSPADGMDDSTEKLIHALRAQSRIAEAIQTINPYCSSKSKKNRHKAIFLRARTYFQGGHFREAFTDFDSLVKSSIVPGRENIFWKALALEKMKQTQEASSLYEDLSRGNDFHSLLAADKYRQLNGRDPSGSQRKSEFQIGTLPGPESRQSVEDLYSKGDVLPALLYLRMHDEAASSLQSVSTDTWSLLNVNANDRRQKYLTLSYLAGIGENFVAATYYSELFVKGLPDRHSFYSAPEPVLRALFPVPYYEPIYRFSSQRNLDPFLVLAIMRQESKFKRFARSPAFARGLMQLIPSTATRIASDLGLKEFSLEHLYMPEVNINLGTRYIQEMIRRFGGRVEVIAAGYNSGESNVRRWLDCTATDETFEFFSNIDLPETRNYVMIVRSNYESYKRTYFNRTSVAAVQPLFDLPQNHNEK